MPQWDPTAYLAFSGERSRPFLDLIARVPGDPATIVDLGCGPGHLMPVLRARWAGARICGVDSSSEMVDRADRENNDPLVTYVQGDIASWVPDDAVDLLVSNAAFQWVPDQLDVIPRLRQHVASGGTLAFQAPNNSDAPSHTLLAELASDPRFRHHTEGVASARGVGARTYLDLLADPDWSLDVWTTTYLHVLAGEDAVFRWISGTGARPYLQALPDDLRPVFEADYRAALCETYPRSEHGTVLPFERVFVVATREPGSVDRP